MAWDFTADSDIQKSMAETLDSKAEQLDGKFGDLYGKIGELGTHWVGSDYDTFKTGCEGYRTALGDMTDTIYMYSDHFKKIATGTDELATALISIVQNMTTRGATPGGGGTGGPDSQTPGQKKPGQNKPKFEGENGATGKGGKDKYQPVAFDDGSGVGGPGGDGTTTGGDRYVGGGTYGDSVQNGITDPNAQAGAVEEQGYWAKLGQRYVDDWNDLKSDFTAAWEGTDGLFSGAWSCVETVLDGGAFVVSGAADTVQGASDMLQSGWNWCFDLGDNRSVQNGSYWQNVGADYAENWDYSNCDSFGEYAGTFIFDSVLGTALDTVQVVGNAGLDAVNGVVEGVDWLFEGATDVVGTIGDWIFG